MQELLQLLNFNSMRETVEIKRRYSKMFKDTCIKTFLALNKLY